MFIPLIHKLIVQINILKKTTTKKTTISCITGIRESHEYNYARTHLANQMHQTNERGSGGFHMVFCKMYPTHVNNLSKTINIRFDQLMQTL